MTRNPTLRLLHSPREIIDLAARIRRVAWSIAAGFCLVLLLAAWWR